MAKIAIQCTTCGKRYWVNCENPDAIRGRLFTCKHCGASAPFAQLMAPGIGSPQPGMRQQAAPPKTFIAGSSGPVVPATPGQAHTRVAGPPMMQAGPRAVLQVESTGKQHPLGPGAYILGRTSSDSMATLQLAPDRYMSRQQARLMVGYSSGVLVCQIEPLSDVNPIYVNRTRLAPGQKYRLKRGDVMLLGSTKVTYTEI